MYKPCLHNCSYENSKIREKQTRDCHDCNPKAKASLERFSLHLVNSITSIHAFSVLSILYTISSIFYFYLIKTIQNIYLENVFRYIIISLDKYFFVVMLFLLRVWIFLNLILLVFYRWCLSCSGNKRIQEFLPVNTFNNILNNVTSY